MFQRSCRALRPELAKPLWTRIDTKLSNTPNLSNLSKYLGNRHFHATRYLQVVKPVLLADIGEGIVECEVIQWFVKPGARVEEFAPLCEVQSDKATVEITSRFAGVVKKLHYEAGEMAKVGQAFVDIDIAEEVGPSLPTKELAPEAVPDAVSLPATPPAAQPTALEPEQLPKGTPEAQKKKFAGSSLATPAVRHLCKELDVDITQVDGTGKDGRVLKEDLLSFVETRKQAATATASQPVDKEDALQQETAVPLTGTPLQMFRTMTKSLAIPHFLYADEVDFTQLFHLRQRVNTAVAQSTDSTASKLSYLPFVIKALSMALLRYPVLNARVDVPASSTEKPQLVFRSQHNIGVAMDTPGGLVVPVVRNVQARSVLSIAAELARLQGLAKTGKLALADLQGGTITVSNIGNIGGTYLSPVIVEREVAILGIGRLRTVPAFDGESDRIVKRHVCHFSFSADHRVVDGATVARAVELVRQLVEQPDTMVVQLR